MSSGSLTALCSGSFNGIDIGASGALALAAGLKDCLLLQGLRYVVHT